MSGRQTRAKRAACPLARDSMRKIAEASGGCLREAARCSDQQL